MASATLPSSSYSTHINTNYLRDDSFATYLGLISQSFAADLALSRAPITSNNNPNSRSSSSQSFTRKRTDDGEIDVFAAEKYFSGTLDTTNNSLDYPNININTKFPEKTQKNKSSSSNKKKKKMKSSQHSTHCSETTSTNSRNIPLRGSVTHQQTSSPRDRDGRRRRRSLLNVFGCICSKRNDVEVEEDADHGCSENVKKWRRRSESSSELFEIESVSRNSGSGCRGMPVAVGGYAPSEASIEWSVMTASAANLSRVNCGGGESTGKKRRSSVSGRIILFGCGSDHKAVISASGVGVEKGEVGSLERYHMMMDLDSASITGAAAVAARPRRASLG